MIQAINEHQPPVGDRFCRDLLGDAFMVWTAGNLLRSPSEGCSRITDSLSDAAFLAISDLASFVASTQQPLLRRISSSHFAWATPSDDSPSSVAVRLVPSDPDQIAELLNQTSHFAWTRNHSLQQSSLQLKEQDEQLRAYAAQVSEDLEELTWLRTLANNLELSESGNSVERIAETVLPSLCRLMNAFTLVFIRDVAVTGMDQNLPMIWQTGKVQIPRHVCLSIVRSLLGRGADRVVVRNSDRPLFADEGFEGAESCVLVPVATESGRLGWLLAVNKDIGQNDNSRTYGEPAYKTYMSEREFGSFEASLMSATAVVLAAHGRNCGLFHEKELLLRGVIRSMINAIDAKDSYTCGHSDRVAEFSRLIAEEMSLDVATCEQIYMTGLLHDVGKIGVPDHVLKKPGQLTDSEFELIKQHPVIGFEILKHLENLSYVLPGVLHHHEAMDGSGYPHGLKGEEIPLAARILAVADSYDAMTSNRPYRRGMPTEKAEAILRDGAGRQWDPVCVDAFFRTAGSVRLIAQQRSTPFRAAFSTTSSTGSTPVTEMQAVG